MAKTNYDDLVEKLNPQKLAMMIAQNSLENSCLYCVHHYDPHCDHLCVSGITKWLMSEVDNEKIS